MATFVLSCTCAPRSKTVLILAQFRHPCLLCFLWYVAVGIVSGLISDVQPLYSTWKGLEILIVLVWGASVLVHLKTKGGHTFLRGCFLSLGLITQATIIWSLWCAWPDVFTDFGRAHRLYTQVPHINSLTLSIMSAYNIVVWPLLLRGSRSLLMPVLVASGIVTLFASQSRTGIVALVSVVPLLLTTLRRLDRKVLILLTTTCVLIIPFLVFEEFRVSFRLSSLQEVLALSGRQYSWVESFEIFTKSPWIGFGIVNAPRFMYEKEYSVDNGILQALLNAGLIGGAPIILYILYVVARFLGLLERVGRLSGDHRRLLHCSFCGLWLGFVKCLVTSAIVVFGFSLLIFLLGAFSLDLAIRKDPAQVKASPQRIRAGRQRTGYPVGMRRAAAVSDPPVFDYKDRA